MVVTTVMFKGTLFYNCTLNVMYWWVFQVRILLFKLTFPFNGNRIEKSGMMKYVFAIITILGKYNYDNNIYIYINN